MRQFIGESLRELVVAKLAEKADQRDRSCPKGRLQAEALEMLGDRIDGLDLWTRLPPRGRRPRLNRSDLATAAVRIADAEGLPALSMRRLATELDVGTMSLYYYVRTKAELLMLVVDTVMAEVIVPEDELPAGWRDALLAIARRSRDSLRRHPWILDIADDPPFGPNSIRHFDQTLQATAGLDAPLVDRLDLTMAVDEYVFGYCFMTRHQVDADRGRAAIPYIETLVETGAYPQLAAMAEELGYQEAWDTVATSAGDDRRFERNLRRLLDGAAADLERDARRD